MAAPMAGKRRSRTGPPLTRERIARTALAIADREGLDALSMRRLAAELDAGTMSLYRHVAGKDELYDAMVEAAMEERDLELPDGDWRQRLHALMDALRRILVEHPVGVQIRLRRPIISPGALRLTDAGMGVLRQAGFAPAEAARVFRTLFLYTFAFCAFSSPADAEETRRQGQAALLRLDPEAYPEVTAVGEHLVESMYREDQFGFGIDLVLDGAEPLRASP
jgi:AcrR family transcriptional regulator